VRSPDFTGLHRIELALWHQGSTREAAAPAAHLTRAVARLRAKVGTMEIDPLEYSLRAHEVLEDGIHLQLSGQASPWSGAALVALRAEVKGTNVVLRTLNPMLVRRDAGGALPQARRALARLSAALDRLERRDGALPRWDRLDQRDRELVDGLTAGAAEQLAYVPELIDPRSAAPRPALVRGRGMKRRAFLGSAAALGAGAAIDRVLGAGRAPRPRRRLTRRSAAAKPIPFEGAHQAGILTPAPPHAIFAAFDSIAPSKAELATALQTLSGPRAAPDRRLRRAAGRARRGADARLRHPRPTRAADGLTVTIASAPRSSTIATAWPRQAARAEADDDLPRRRPGGRGVPWRRPGPAVRQQRADAAQRAARSHARHARRARAALEDRGLPGGRAGARRAAQPARLQGRHGQPGDRRPPPHGPGGVGRHGEPSWAAGGTYQVVRIIRNRVEFWDRVARQEQELMIGRDKGTGAPLGRPRETHDPGYPSDPKGERIPLDAHIRLARPRTPKSEGSRILRRGYSYSRGLDMSGQLDMGLVFCCFQADVERQFEVVQKRLAGEPLIDYVVPTGGGYFFAPRGARDGEDWVGSGLLA
jgi:deferrochelatase/peroxidase EfeB